MKSLGNVVLIICFYTLLILSCSNKNSTNSNEDNTNNYQIGTVIDIDNNEYQTIKIGNQWWMAENLKVIHYRNGQAIQHVTDNNQWTNLKTDAYCAYNNDNSNNVTYGLLYNCYAVEDVRNIAPEGWHVPTDEEWIELEIYLGMTQNETEATGYRGTNEGEKLKSEVGWNNAGNGTNSSGFSALPGGYRISYSGSFFDVGSHGYWWTATEFDSITNWGRTLDYVNSTVARYYCSKQFGYSVRCIKD